MGASIHRFTMTLPVIAACLAIPLAATTPTAAAEPSGCMASGQTLEYCERQYIPSANSVGSQWVTPPAVMEPMTAHHSLPRASA